MSALSLRRWSVRDMALVTGFVAWTVLVSLTRLGFVLESGPAWQALTYGVPAVLLAAAWLERADPGILPHVAGAAVCVLLALLAPSLVSDHPKLAFALPGAVIAGMLTQRYATTALVALVLFTGIYGSVEAFVGLPGDRSATWVLQALWAGVIGRALIGRREHPVRVTPVTFLLAGFLALSVIAAATTDPSSSGMQALHYAPEYFSVVLLIGYGGFSARQIHGASRALVIVCFAVDAYAALRWAIGPAAAETALQKTYQDVIYNQLTYSGGTKVQGSFPNGNLLGLWLACTTPFVLAAALAWKGRIRAVAVATMPLAMIALLGSAQRTALAGLVAALATVVVVHLLSRGHRGPRLGVVLAAVMALIVTAAVVYPAVANNPEKRQRYSNLLTPSQDLPFQQRIQKWRDALIAIDGARFGHGLGSGNPSNVGGFRFADISNVAIDNSFLVIGYEQGFAVMCFFAVMMLVLLVELLRFAVWTRGPSVAVLGTAAVGTVVALLVEFMAADYQAAPPIMAGWAIIGLGLAAFSLPSDDDSSAAHAAP